MECPRCGTANADDARFCQRCGRELASRPTGREERKLVSALFVDLVGSTARADGRDPEEFRDGLERYYTAVKREIERFGGAVEKFIGDAVVAIFGAPVAHGDDAERAVRAGLGVLQAMRDLNEQHPSLRIEVRAAVNTGEAIVSVDARPDLGDAFAFGDAINTASRLQNAAPSGRLIVGAQTYRATRRAIAYEALPPIEARGKAEPIEAWLAVEPLDRAGTRLAMEVPFVGRGRELEHLLGIWDRVVEDRRPQIVTILGHPGMGKSRIATELTSRVDAGRATVVTGRCLPYAEQTGFRASADHVKRLAGILETDPPREAREKLGTMVADVVPAEEASEITRYLSLLLGLGTDEPTDDRLPLFFAMRRLIESLAAARPTIAAFEDLHWADESQLDLLEYLAQHIRDVPLLLLVLGRPELLDLRPTWGAGLLAHTTIPLEPLAPMDAAAIATHTLGSASSDAVERLVEVAGGNPLFIEELAASLEEGAEAEGSLPATVREAISSRIDVLPTGQREVLLDASVIGKTFWRGVLRSVAGASEVDEALTALEARDLIRRVPTSRVEGDVEFTFKHMLIREVAYATLARAARRDRHAAIARYLEEDAADNERELAWLLAHHWREAGDHARAVDHLLVAAELARERWAKEEVSNLYEDVLQLVGSSDIERRNRIRLLRGIDLVDLGDLEAGAKELDEIIPMLHGRDQLEAILARLRTTFFLEETEQAFSLSKRAIELATELGDPELLAPSIGYLSGAYIMTGELANAREENRRALSLWVPNSRRADLAAVKELHAEIYYWIGEYQVAEELSRSAYEIGGEVHRVESLLRGGGWQGLTLAAMGRTEESMDLLDRIIERARELGQPRWAAGPLNYSSQSYRDLYLVDEARRRNEESLEMVTTHGEWGMPRLQGSIDLLLADLMQGEVGRAQAAWPELWDAAINGKTWRPWLGGVRLALVRAEIALETEGPEASIDWAHETIVRAAATGRIKYEMLARTVLGDALMQLGRAPEAIPEVRTAVRISDRLGTPAHRWQTRAALGRVLMAVGEDDGARTAFTEARGVIEAWAATLSAEHSGALLAAEPVRDALETTR